MTRSVLVPSPRPAIFLILCGLAAPLAAMLPLEASALAQETDSTSSQKRVLLGAISGVKTESTRKALVSGLSSDSAVVLLDEPEIALDAGAPAESVLQIAQEKEADVILIVKTSFAKKGFSASLEVRDGRDGSTLETTTISGGSLKDFVAKLEAHDEIKGSIALARGIEKAPPPEEAPAAPAPAASTAPPKEEDEGSGGPSPLRLQAGLRLYSRSFRYTDSLAQLAPALGFPELVTYNLATAPMPFVQGTWYPAAHFSDGVLAHIGLRGGFEFGVATNVVYNGATLNQDHSLWFAGLRGRIPVMAEGEFGVLASFASHNFAVTGDADENGNSVFPDVGYRLVDLGVDTEWRFSGVILGANFDYLIPVGLGEVASADWFPEASAAGMDLGAKLGLEISPVLDAVIGVSGRSYGFNFNPIADGADPSKIAGGATDRYVSFWFALGLNWPGEEGSSAAKGEASGDGSSAAPATTEGGGADSFDSFD